MPDERSKYDGRHSEENRQPPAQLENDPRIYHADPALPAGELSNSPNEPLSRGAPEPDEQTKLERDEMIDQIEEFEGPSRREVRGDNSEPPDDPGVAHS